jgi:hypothetical protein
MGWQGAPERRGRAAGGARRGAPFRRVTALVAGFILLATLLVTVAAPAHAANTYYLTTFAGQQNSYGSTGDGGQATSAQLEFPRGVTGDNAGNIYIADANNNKVRKVNSAGVISTFAGTGTGGAAGDGGAATSAQLNYPMGIAADAAGNVYIADEGNNRVRKVAAGTGIITTFAGTGTPGFSGDGSAATAADLHGPVDVTVDAFGDVIIAVRWSARIRKVDADTGIITTIAGNGFGGYTGDGGPAAAAQVDRPEGVSFDKAGDLYIADRNNHAIRKITTATGIITTVAGTGVSGSSGMGGPAASAQLTNPERVVVDALGFMYISEPSSHRIRVVDPATGNISNFAGNGVGAFSGEGGLASAAQVNEPIGLWVSESFSIYIAEASNNIIRRAYLAGDNTSALNANIDPMLSLSVGAHAGACNGVSQSATSSASATTARLGDANIGVNGVVAQDFGVVTNAASGYTLYMRYSGQLTDGAGHNIANLAATNASPGAFLSPGTEAFAYTTSDSSLTGTADRFTNPSANWAALSTANAEIGHAATGYVNKTICVAYQVGAAATTVAGSYTTTVLVTAVPSY